MKIAWIGTGVMGKAMVFHIANYYKEVFVYNRTREKAENIHKNITVCDSIEEACLNADVIFTMLGYPSDVKNVFDIIFKVAKKDALAIDMTTSSPTLAKELYTLGKLHHIFVLDAPVTGGDLGALNQTLSIMVGGDESNFNQALPLFKILGKTITYMGSAGQGQLMKLTNQIVIASNILGIAESISFAKEHQIDLNKALDVINHGSAHSWQAQNNGLKMIKNDMKPGFYVKHFLKDLGLAFEHSNQDLPLTKLAHQAYTYLSNLGYQDQGTQAIIYYYLKELEQ